MSYVDTVLQPGETVRFRTNFHWVGFLPGIVLLVLAGLCYLRMDNPDSWRSMWSILALMLLVAALVLLLKSWYERWITEIAVTNRRVIYKSGFFSRKTDEMPLAKIENIEITQSIPGRFLGYGTVRILGTGGNVIGEDKLTRIAAPLEFRDNVMAE